MTHLNSTQTLDTHFPSELTEVCFISDLHLSANMPKTLVQFEHFCKTIAPTFKTLIILGDLFEYWLGDDTISSNPIATHVANTLAALSDSGVTIGLIVGNRDFLVRHEFCQLAKITALPDPTILKINGQTTLLTHGDLLCINDFAYQRFRRFARMNWVQNLFLKAPLSLRESLAKHLRKKSKYSKKTAKTQAEYLIKQNVPLETAQSWFKKYAVRYLIHGHTHQPSTYLTFDTTRVVLPDWDCENEESTHWGYIEWRASQKDPILHLQENTLYKGNDAQSFAFGYHGTGT